MSSKIAIFNEKRGKNVESPINDGHLITTINGRGCLVYERNFSTFFGLYFGLSLAFFRAFWRFFPNALHAAEY